MEQNTNKEFASAAEDDPELIPTRRAPIPVPRQSDRLADDAGHSVSPIRADGWTDHRIRTFLHVLSRGGDVTEAARFVGKSRQSAYAFRAAPRGRAFAAAWDAALLLAHKRLEDDLLGRAIYGNVDLYVKDGKVVGERHRHDNRLALAMLVRRDRRFKSGASNADVAIVAGEFGAFVEIACRGGAGAADFFAERHLGGDWWRKGREAELYEAGAREAAAWAAAIDEDCMENLSTSTSSSGIEPES